MSKTSKIPPWLKMLSKRRSPEVVTIEENAPLRKEKSGPSNEPVKGPANQDLFKPIKFSNVSFFKAHVEQAEFVLKEARKFCDFDVYDDLKFDKFIEQLKQYEKDLHNPPDTLEAEWYIRVTKAIRNLRDRVIELINKKDKLLNRKPVSHSEPKAETVQRREQMKSNKNSNEHRRSSPQAAYKDKPYPVASKSENGGAEFSRNGSAKPAYHQKRPSSTHYENDEYAHPNKKVRLRENDSDPHKHSYHNSDQQFSPGSQAFFNLRRTITQQFPSTKRSPPPMRRPSPGEQRPSSRERRPSPRERRLPPGERRLSPGERHLPPGERRPSPGERRLPPGERRLPPGEQRLSPRERRPSPVERRVPPGERRPSPVRRFPSPVRVTPLPTRRFPQHIRQSPSPPRRSPSPRRFPPRPQHLSPERRSPLPTHRHSPTRRYHRPTRQSPSPRRPPTHRSPSPTRYPHPRHPPTPPRYLAARSPSPIRRYSPPRRSPSPQRLVRIHRSPSPTRRYPAHSRLSPKLSPGRRFHHSRRSHSPRRRSPSPLYPPSPMRRFHTRLSPSPPGTSSYKVRADESRSFRSMMELAPIDQVPKEIFNARRKPLATCYFCGRGHWSHLCVKINTLEERQDFYMSHHLCFNCGKDHRGKKCLMADNRCKWPHCAAVGEHHSAVCPNAPYPITFPVVNDYIDYLTRGRMMYFPETWHH